MQKLSRVKISPTHSKLEAVATGVADLGLWVSHVTTCPHPVRRLPHDSQAPRGLQRHVHRLLTFQPQDTSKSSNLKLRDKNPGTILNGNFTDFYLKVVKAKSKSQQSVILTRQVVGHLNILSSLSTSSCSTICMTAWYHYHNSTYRIAGRLTLRLGNCTLWSRVTRNTQNARIHTIVWAYLCKISRSQNDAKWNRMKMPQDRSFRLLGNAEVLRKADKNVQKS